MSKPSPFLFHKEGDSQFPFLRNMYEFYSPRSKTIEAWSFGMEFCGVEATLIETTGCPVKIFDHRPEAAARFAKCESVLKSHTADEKDPEWLKELSKKWILPNKLSFSATLPSSYTGIRILSDTSEVRFEKTNTQKLDFVKIDYKELNCSILYDLLTAGYRPGIFLLHWDEHPDQFNHTMLAAGHLQNTGYSLAAEKDNWFFYVYNDECIYESTSWARTDVPNPFLHEFKQNILDSFLKGSIKNPTTE